MAGMIKPAGHRVLVRPHDLDEVSAGGILLTHDPRKRAAQVKGTLEAIGPTAWKAEGLGGENWAEVGQTVYYEKYDGWEIEVDKVKYRLLNDTDICAIEVM